MEDTTATNDTTAKATDNPEGMIQSLKSFVSVDLDDVTNRIKKEVSVKVHEAVKNESKTNSSVQHVVENPGFAENDHEEKTDNTKSSCGNRGKNKTKKPR